ncbi:hypothetical protein BD324DRAFT_637873 [Kockovaella imperatae]|uniref:Uncharacterized protein n=1 Tax=Kockovaella imperatae TaxID=4999 RepID=A0A1Y1U7H4_9TREE|nr:hypothetical protein BD324DRAFT_637873 [Kockovaella imperatae]ORX33980.1 hypothetical protein BD324DRAFT_637873 [Kockovaella imperatae]
MLLMLSFSALGRRRHRLSSSSYVWPPFCRCIQNDAFLSSSGNPLTDSSHILRLCVANAITSWRLSSCDPPWGNSLSCRNSPLDSALAKTLKRRLTLSSEYSRVLTRLPMARTSAFDGTVDVSLLSWAQRSFNIRFSPSGSEVTVALLNQPCAKVDSLSDSRS